VQFADDYTATSQMLLQNVQLRGVCCVSQGFIHRQVDFVLSKPLFLYRIMMSNMIFSYRNMWLIKFVINVTFDECID